MVGVWWAEAALGSLSGEEPTKVSLMFQVIDAETQKTSSAPWQVFMFRLRSELRLVSCLFQAFPRTALSPPVSSEESRLLVFRLNKQSVLQRKWHFELFRHILHNDGDAGSFVPESGQFQSSSAPWLRGQNETPEALRIRDTWEDFVVKLRPEWKENAQNLRTNVSLCRDIFTILWRILTHFESDGGNVSLTSRDLGNKLKEECRFL